MQIALPETCKMRKHEVHRLGFLWWQDGLV